LAALLANPNKRIRKRATVRGKMEIRKAKQANDEMKAKKYMMSASEPGTLIHVRRMNSEERTKVQ
jgi:hypothetical protein